MSGPGKSREWNAEAYHRLSGPQKSWGQKVLERIRLRGDETILDAGCGTGRLTADLLQALPRGRVIGIDLSQNMLRAAREHTAHSGTRVSFVAGDFVQMPFVRAFDGIFSTAAFHWVLDHDVLFANLYAALRPGGWLIAQCGGGPNLKRLRDRADELMASPKFASSFAGFHEPWEYSDAETAAARLRKAGFTSVETNLEPALTTMDGAAHFSDFVKSVIMRLHLQRLSRPLQDEFLARLTERAAGDDPPFSLDYWRLNLSARVPS